VFKSLAKAALSIVTLPVDAVADVVTMGGCLNDREEPYTASKARKVIENIDDAVRPEETK
jgi:hypothetical protein